MTHCAHDGTRRDDESDGYLEWVEAFMETDPGDRHQVGLIVRDLLARVRRRDRTTSNVAALVNAAQEYEAAVERDERLRVAGHYSSANEDDRKRKLDALRAALRAWGKPS